MGERFEIDPGASKVWLEGSSSVHPIRAHASGLTGWVELLSKDGQEEIDGEVRIDVGLLKSGNPLVDRETKRRINAAEHPEIIGTVIGSKRTGSLVAGGEHYEVHGEIGFRGHVGPAHGEVTASLADDTLTVEGTETFDVRDWGLTLPRMGLLKVHPDVEVRIELVAR
ncbi:MAG: YceI family protein [Microthrixaceae bacterium]